jgi:ATP-dependent RNA helicase RhlE
MPSFSELQISEPLLRAIKERNYLTPTPIQAQAIPHLLQGRDLLGIAQTGTGKTAAFALPILQRLGPSRDRAAGLPRALILTPTRELALQIADSFRAYGRYLPLRHAIAYGGVGHKPQIDALARGADILVATPGRLLDLMQMRHVRFDRLEVFVLDEADRMLDMGFLRDVKRIIAALPKKRQTLLFSATMPEDITELSRTLLDQPVRVEVTPAASTVELVDQRVMFVAKSDKRLLLKDVLKDPAFSRCLIFARTKHGANRIAEQLERDRVNATAIHGNKSQSARQRALEGFRNGDIRVLVATDIAARGLDIQGITHVINFDLPEVAEGYVHRIGRTARAGAAGIALSFCDPAERDLLRDIEKLTRCKIAIVPDHAYAGGQGASAPVAPQAPRRPAGNGRSQGARKPFRPAAKRHGSGGSLAASGHPAR